MTITTTQDLSPVKAHMSLLLEEINSIEVECDATIFFFRRIPSTPIETCIERAMCKKISHFPKREPKFSAKSWMDAILLKQTNCPSSETLQNDRLFGVSNVIASIPSIYSMVKTIVLGGRGIPSRHYIPNSNIYHSGESISSTEYCYLNKEFQKNDTGTIPIVKRLQYKKRTMWAYWRQSIIMRKIFWKLLQALNAIGKVLYLKPKHKGGNILKTIFNQPNPVMIYS